ncbi:hypothetical protein JK210_13460 [Acetobacter persici]|nr:hypothetical protein [Acetobacter persici]
MLLLSACAGQQNCDPSQTELFTSMACMSNGGYQRRAAALQTESQSSQEVALLEREKAIKAERAAQVAQNKANSTAVSTRAQMATLRANVRASQNQMAQLKKSRAQLLQQKAALSAQLQQAQQQLATAKADPSSTAAEIDRINRKIATLEAQQQTNISDIAQSGG